MYKNLKISHTVMEILEKLHKNDNFRLTYIANQWEFSHLAQPLMVRGPVLYLRINKYAQLNYPYEEPQILQWLAAFNINKIIKCKKI